MGNVNRKLTGRMLNKFIASVGLSLSLVTTAVTADITINVVDENNLPVSGFKWLLEEDNTFPVTPGVQQQESLGINFHKSYAPVLASGESAGSSATIVADPAKSYFVSILPYSGHQMIGAKVEADPAAAGPIAIEVIANTLPIPTALIAINIFPDVLALDGFQQLPVEVPQPDPGLPDYNGFDPTQFSIQLHDPAGQMLVDAFGNLLGTEYAGTDTSVITKPGTLTLRPDANGRLVIRNLVPGKYGITVVPPAGEGWQQTTTIEGGRAIDAWVDANESQWWKEFGAPGSHAFFGFVQPTDNFSGSGVPGFTVSGQVVNNHMARPPAIDFQPGHPLPNCWIAIQNSVGTSGGVQYAQPCDTDASTFSVANVPPGTYDLVIWDTYMDIIINTQVINVTADLALGDLQVFNWFSRLDFTVFNDVDQDGFRDPGETGVIDQNINLRFRDGRVYQAAGTDPLGEAPFFEVFPWFHWLVAEVDFARFKATGVTYIVDDGGAIPADNGWVTPSRDLLNPQPQLVDNINTGNDLSTTLEGPVLSLAFQGMLGQTSVMEFGKTEYDIAASENGGISGIVFYAVTRAEDDPAYAAGEEWEPGIPRVQVNLYNSITDVFNPTLSEIADNDGNGIIELADIDNYPFGWADGSAPMGPEDVDRAGVPGVVGVVGGYDIGDAVQTTVTDSWDDSQPTGCKGDPFIAHAGTPIAKTTDCYDGLRVFNQVRPGVFDGGYAFDVPAIGYYIVEATTPPGYVLLKEEDKNVDFGEEVIPSPQKLPPICIGDPHTVPPFLSFQTDSLGNPIVPAPDLIDSPFAGTDRPLCDRKLVELKKGNNAAADFFLFTDVPVAAHVSGTSLNDVGNENDPNNPNFGEKFGLNWMPVVFRDWRGTKVTKVYTDEFGHYNAMLPSTYTINAPSGTGVSPNMLTACMNDPDPQPNATGGVDLDPFYKPDVSSTCFTFNYTPGATTYLDTPVIPIAAFAPVSQFPADCELPQTEPGIAEVTQISGATSNGPRIIAGATGPDRVLTILSRGIVDVPNPQYDGTNATPALIARNYGFGATAGTVEIGGVPLVVNSWTDAEITATVPATGVSTGTLSVINSGGVSSTVGVTVTMDIAATAVHTVVPGAGLEVTPIQDAIDAANSGDLILVSPGQYYELVIMYKPVKLQGFGAASTTINGLKQPNQKLTDWRTKIADLYLTQNAFDLAAGQTLATQQLPSDPILFQLEEGPAILVVSTDPARGAGFDWSAFAPRIDGLTITGADQGGGLLVNGFAHSLEISNNRISSNSGNFSGAIKVGDLSHQATNVGLSIHNNQISQNGNTTVTGAGAGISLYPGADNYSIANNFICGNFALGDGGGIAHEGLSDGGSITDNRIVFNQNFTQMGAADGAGVFIGGIAGLTGPSEGSGSVTIEGNIIEGNHSGSGSGAGIRLRSVNGTDVVGGVPVYTVNIYDNMITGNVAGDAGGGIAILDAASVNIVNNTIAHNDSTATTGRNLLNANETTLQPGAGIHSALYSAALKGTGIAGDFADPRIVNNIIWENRSFRWFTTPGAVPPIFGLVPPLGQLGTDLYVEGGDTLPITAELNPVNGILTSLTNNSGGLYDASNVVGDPQFINAFANCDRADALPCSGTIPTTSAAVDEGGNFIDVQYGPLTMVRDYHLATDLSPAANIGQDTVAEVGVDIDGDARAAVSVDAGADEVLGAVLDSDGDGIFDSVDNCTLAVNPTQFDADADGYGNRCDADFDNDGTVTVADYFMFLLAFGTNDPVKDLDEDGSVTVGDYFLFLLMFGGPPGPSALAP